MPDTDPSNDDLYGGDPSFALIISALADLPHRDRNEIIVFMDFWREFTLQDRAIFAKSVKPDLTDDDVAHLPAWSDQEGAVAAFCKVGLKFSKKSDGTLTPVR
jgi:hypothetical protein